MNERPEPARSGMGRRAALILALTLLLPACATQPLFSLESVAHPYPPVETPENDRILHARTGYSLAKEELFDLLATARVVFVSEAHDSVSAHRVQAEIIDALATRFPGRVAVGMEMFRASAQPELDRYGRGELSKKEFEKLWHRHWRVESDYYRPVLDVIERHGLPILGLNAEKSQVASVSSHGPGSPPAETPEVALPEIDGSDPYQRAFLQAIFAGHGKGHGESTSMLDRFQLVQNLWEESMAENADRFLRSEKGKDALLVILAGGHHIDYGFGIPRRLFRRSPRPYAMVRPEYLSLEAVPEEQLMDVNPPDLPLPMTDFFWYVDYRKAEFTPRKLGVFIRPAEGETGMEVLDVVPETVAQTSGIRKGDILIRLNDEALKESFDLTWGLKQLGPGETAELELLRNGEAQTKRIHFPAP